VYNKIKNKENLKKKHTLFFKKKKCITFSAKN